LLPTWLKKSAMSAAVAEPAVGVLACWARPWTEGSHATANVNANNPCRNLSVFIV
jgi:hypothetical protein